MLDVTLNMQISVGEGLGANSISSIDSSVVPLIHHAPWLTLLPVLRVKRLPRAAIAQAWREGLRSLGGERRGDSTHMMDING